jgi:hypothetical protein
MCDAILTHLGHVVRVVCSRPRFLFPSSPESVTLVRLYPTGSIVRDLHFPWYRGSALRPRQAAQ